MNQITQVIVTSLLLFFLSSCSSSNINDSAIKKVNIDTTRNLLSQENRVVILDVRTPEEYKLGHIQGALNVNIMDDKFTNEISKLERNQTYIVHCAANAKDGRTDKSLKIMKNLGFNNLFDMSGGINKWVQEGNPIIK